MHRFAHAVSLGGPHACGSNRRTPGGDVSPREGRFSTPYAPDVITLTSERLRCDIAPSIGAGVARFDLLHPSRGVVPLWRPAAPDASAFTALASYSLVPWSNRIDEARLRFGGREHSLRPDWMDGTAIHGDAKHRPWTLLDRAPGSAHLALDASDLADRNFPWAYLADVRYELRGGTLLTTLGVVNRSKEPFPAGLGFHPFWARRLRDDAGPLGDEAVVTLDVEGRYPCERIMACGPASKDEVTRRLNAGTTLVGLDLDDVFSGFNGKASIRWPGSGIAARYDCSPECSHAVLYSPQSGPVAPWFCLEPVTMVNNGINLREGGWQGTGVRVLEPGERLVAVWSVTIDVERA